MFMNQFLLISVAVTQRSGVGGMIFSFVLRWQLSKIADSFPMFDSLREMTATKSCKYGSIERFSSCSGD